MINSLVSLASELQPFASGLRSSQMLSDPGQMTKVRKEVASLHNSASIKVSATSILSAVERLRKAGAVASFRELKYACLGVSLPLADGWCALTDAMAMLTLCRAAESQAEPRRRLRCFQGLLSSYWAFPLNDAKTSRDAVQGWTDLRSWLAKELHNLARLPGSKPDWFKVIEQHSELLGENPCAKFGPGLLIGNGAELGGVRETLSISSSSWVIEEALFAQIQSACDLSDDAFANSLSQLLRASLGRAGVEVGDRIKIRCVARLISRYARSTSHPEHAGLRDAAISLIGNPWLHRPKWDTWVVDRGRADALGREMVDGWLKSRLVLDFFELLSADGTGDRRRVDYWLKFVPHIDDMWFALGSDAQSLKSTAFREFRSRAKGRLLDLLGTSGDNNAFVMRIGSYLAVEFGSKGNAFFLFEWNSLDKALADTLGGGFQAVYRQTLADKDKCSLRLVHFDKKIGPWERTFDEELSRLMNVPGSHVKQKLPPLESKQLFFSEHNLAAFVKQHALLTNDFRSKSGAFWVLGQPQSPEVLTQLKAWGFRLKTGKGWYRE